MLRIAHRGASAYAPENTIGAFKKALAMGADGVELDVHRCKSGELVVIHDDTLERTTNGRGLVADFTLGELKRLRTANDEAIPTLDEVLKALDNACCFIEVKHEDAALPVAKLIAAQMKKDVPADRLWLISFHHECLKAALKACPGLNVGASFETLTLSEIHEVHGWGARAIGPHYQSLGLQEVTAAQALGMKVICWTVNDPGDIARMKAIGVDGIIGDYPDRL